jgi:hypothetical protein
LTRNVFSTWRSVINTRRFQVLSPTWIIFDDCLKYSSSYSFYIRCNILITAHYYSHYE